MQRAIEFLLSDQSPEGAWSYRSGDTWATEPTAAAILALRDERDGEAAQAAAIRLLLARQRNDGGWAYNLGDGSGSWETSWSVLALIMTAPGTDPARLGARWLLNVPVHPQVTDSMEELPKGAANQPAALIGWPWRPGEGVWVEPTALALLALSAAGVNPSERRVQEGLSYLQSRRCDGGGWNVGSPRMFSKSLPPRAVPSALAILVLTRSNPSAILPEDVAVVTADALQDGGSLALAWALLALRDFGKDDAGLHRALLAQQEPNGSWGGSAYQTALAILARKGLP